MRSGNCSFPLLAVLVLGIGIIVARAQSPSRPPLIIEPQAPRVAGPSLSILKMVQSGVETNVVVAFVDSCAAPFGMTADDVLTMRAKGVPSDVLAAMLRHDAEILHISRTAPPAVSAAPARNEEEAPIESKPVKQPEENPTPQAAANYDDWGGYGWWGGGYPGSYWRRGGNACVQPRNTWNPRPGSVSFPAATIPGTVPLVQPTVPLVQPSPQSIPRAVRVGSLK